MDFPTTVEAYTIPLAAAALGKTELTFKRWIEDDLIPVPILKDTVRGYRHYSVGEVQIMANVLSEHEREYTYYSTRHEHTKQQLMQLIYAWRRMYI
jgi:hypothetical protein